MKTDEARADLEYSVSCGRHDCDSMVARPEFGVFKTFAEAERRARFLNGRVMVRRISDWAPASARFTSDEQVAS